MYTSFLLIATDDYGTAKEFVGQFDELELVFDLMSYIIAQGYSLREVRISDGQGSISIPLEAFDGQLTGRVIKQLEQDWKQVLMKK